MKKAKNIISLLLVSILVFSVTACGKNDDISETESTTINTEVYVDNTVQATVTNPVSQTSETFTQGAQNYSTPSASATVPQSQTPQAAAPSPSTPADNTPAVQETPTAQPTQAPQNDITPSGGYGSYTADYQGINQIVFYPAAAENSDAAYPVVIFANGTGFDYKIYEKLLISIAESGYIVVANSETMSADGTAQRASLDFIIAENTNSSSLLYKNVNTQKAAATGHSQGGRSAVNAAAADSRFDCVVSFAGSNYTEEAEKLSTPALFMAGTMDMIVNANQWVKPAYDVCKGPAVYVSLVNGIHTSCCTNPETYIPYVTKWLNIWLNGDTSSKADFRAGGQLSQDGAWTEFSSKGF